jgi:hypothetical protein
MNIIPRLPNSQAIGMVDIEDFGSKRFKKTLNTFEHRLKS